MSPRTLRIKITKPGWLFIWLCLGVGFSALNTGNNLLYLVFGMMLSFLILSGLLSNNSLKKLRIEPIFPSRIFAEQPVPVRMNLENRKRTVPSYAINLTPQADQIQRRSGAFVVKIPPNSSVTTTDHIQFPKRGETTLPPYYVETSYPFGLIRKSLLVPSVGKAIVYPRLLDINTWVGQQRKLLGEYLSGLKGGQSNPYGIREYVTGDPARLIHWKTSAKQNRWFVREFEREKKLRIVLDVTLAPKNQSTPSVLEKALSAAGSLIFAFTKRGLEVVLRLNGETIDVEGRGYLDAYLTALALAVPPEARPTPIKSEESTSIVTVSDQPSSLLSGDIIFGREQLQQL